jgi:hypothetical protein
MYCEKYTVDDFLQRCLDFTPRSAVVRGDLFAVVDPLALAMSIRPAISKTSGCRSMFL